ncbi:MAG: hypothetical protein AABY55_04165 [Candidatus Omnitrophota bacterium]
MYKASRKNVIIIGTSFLLIFFIAALLVSLKPRQKVDRVKGLVKLMNRLDEALELIEKQKDKISSNIILDHAYVTDNVSISGILWDLNKPLAIINNKVVGLNDEIQGFQVVGINKDNVVLRDSSGQEKVNFIHENNLLQENAF